MLCLLLCAAMGVGKAETGFSRDSLRAAIVILEKLPSSFSRDSSLSVYYNELIEKLNYGSLPGVGETLETFARKQKGYRWPVSMAFVLRARARIHEKSGDYLKAVQEYHEAIRTMEGEAYIGEQLAYTYVLLAYAVLNNGDRFKAWDLFERSAEISKNVDDKSILIWALDFFGDNTLFHAENRSDYLKALAYYKEVEALLPESRVANQIPNNLQGQAKAYALLGEGERAAEYRQKALDYALALPVPNYFNVYETYRDWAAFEASEGRADSAIVYQQRALDAALKFNFVEILNRAYHSLYIYQKKAGRYPEALGTLEAYTRLEDSLNRQEVNKKYAELDGKYENEKSQNRIKSLENKNLKYGLAVLLVSLSGGLIALFVSLRGKRKVAALNSQLAERNHQVEEALYEGKKLERRRVSDQLHDSIATKVSALKWKVEANEGKIDPATFESLRSSLEEIYEDVRTTAHGLRPLEFLDKGLKSAIEELLGHLTDQKRTFFSIYIDDGVSRLNKSLQYHIYQWTVELCTNLQKHAKATRVFFEVHVTGDTVTVWFENDGLLDNRPLKEGQGLRNIRAKASEYRAMMRVEKQGLFRFELKIPL